MIERRPLEVWSTTYRIRRRLYYLGPLPVPFSPTLGGFVAWGVVQLLTVSALNMAGVHFSPGLLAVYIGPPVLVGALAGVELAEQRSTGAWLLARVRWLAEPSTMTTGCRSRRERDLRR